MNPPIFWRREIPRTANPLSDVVPWSENTGNKLHPTQKPIAILKPFIESYSPVGGTVLDPFAGSGSTLLAAKMLGRKWLGVEMDAKYHAVASERLRLSS